MLGMTETGSVCLASEDESEQPEGRRGSFGRPVPGFEARVVDPDTGKECGPGEPGELHFRGRFMMEGYYADDVERQARPAGAEGPARRLTLSPACCPATSALAVRS